MDSTKRYALPLGQTREYLRRNYGWFLALGVILVILGILAIAYMAATTIVSVLIFGAVLAAAGIVQIIEGFGIRKWEGVLLHIIIGILYFVSGCIMILSPGSGAVFLTVLLSAFLLLVGLIRIVSSIGLRFKRWGWTFMSGLISILAGIFLYLTLPFSGFWIIGFFVGIDLLFYGLSMLTFAAGVKKRKLYT